MSCTLGIDPGDPGAAVLLGHDGVLVMAALWGEVGRRGRPACCWYGGGEVHEALLKRRPGAVGDWLVGRLRVAAAAHVQLAIEDVYVGPSPSTAVTLARWTGAVAAPIEGALDIEARYVRAADWRRTVLGLPIATRREEAKAASLRLMPALVPGLAGALAVLGEHDHLTDAAGIARWSLRR